MKFLVFVSILLKLVCAHVQYGDIAVVYSGIANLVPSTTYHPSYDETRLRLHFDQNVEGSPGWQTSYADLNQWISLSTHKPYHWTTIITQGRSDLDYWVTSYTIDYTNDGTNWIEYDNARFFQGNYDRKHLVTHYLDPPIEARAIRLRPWRYFGTVSMRMEAYVRSMEDDIPAYAAEPIGAIEAGALVDSSSEYDASSTVLRLRLNFNQYRDGAACWLAATNDENQWVQISAHKIVEWVKFSTQGRYDADQWVKSYKLKYTEDGITWHDFEGGKEFEGNTDRLSTVTHEFSDPLLARSIRLLPVSWYGHIALRMEAYYNEFSS